MKKGVGALVIALAVTGLVAKMSPKPAGETEPGDEPARASEREERAGTSSPQPVRRLPAGESAKAAPATAPATAPSRVRELADHLREINACYQKSCDYPDTYPHDYENGVGQALKKTLRQLRDIVREEKLESEELASLAREFLANSDGHVKEAALDLMSTQPPSSANRDSLLNDVIGDHDANLIAHGLLELRRYDGAADQAKIQQALADSMETGAPYVAMAVAEGIAPFLSDSSVPTYRQVAKNLSAGSVVRNNLEASLDEYRRHKSGG